MPHPQYDNSEFESTCLTQYENSDGLSDFPPIRKCNSTPDPPTRYHSKQHSSPSQSPRLFCSRLNKKGLGDKNMLNRVQVSVGQAKDVPRAGSRKRKSESHNLAHAAHLRSSKKRRLFDKDDKDWLKREIDDVRDHMIQISDHLREDVDSKLDEILGKLEVRLLSQI